MSERQRQRRWRSENIMADDIVDEIARIAKLKICESPDNQAARFTLAALDKLMAGEAFEAVVPDKPLAAIERFAASINATVSAERFERGAIRVRLEPAGAA
jgi:hypothetical protein